MSNVVPLFKALPQEDLDPRISALYSAFGRRPFSLGQCAETLGIDFEEARHILLVKPLADARFRVSPYSLGFWLIPTGPEQRAAQTWKKVYEPVIHELVKEKTAFTNVDFAKRAEVSYPSANYILSILTRDGLLSIQALDHGGPPHFSLKRKRRRVIRAF